MTLEYLGYTKEPCTHCGRVRVEKYSDGRLVCEKCLYNQNKEEFEDEYFYLREVVGFYEEDEG